MPGPKSLSVAQISNAAEVSVMEALSRHRSFPTPPPFRIGFVPPHWWFGFVLYDPKSIDGLTFGDAQKLSSDVHASIAKEVSEVGGGKPGFVRGKDYLVMGFAPPIDVDLVQR